MRAPRYRPLPTCGLLETASRNGDLRMLTRRAPVVAALLLTLSSACAPNLRHGTEADAPDDDAELGTASSAVTTTELFATTSLAKGASKTGIYTATVAGELTFR